jgi:hypothetical protein
MAGGPASYNGINPNAVRNLIDVHIRTVGTTLPISCNIIYNIYWVIPIFFFFIYFFDCRPFLVITVITLNSNEIKEKQN